MTNNLRISTVFTLLVGLILSLSNFVSAAETRLEKPYGASGKAVLSFAMDPLVTMTEVPFKIELYDTKGKAVPDASLSISLDMPAMPMPPNHPKATWQDNAYRGIAIFTMAGAWEAFIDVARPGHETEKLVFEIDRVMMK